MKETTLNGKQSAMPLPRRQSAAPIAFLIFASPVLAELLMGATHLTNIWILIPEMAVYGSAALIIREVVRRQGRGWGTILLLGIAYALAEECVILQTSLTPAFFPPNSFGLVAGVQWIYLVALVWYESIYAIVLPIYLTEMLFPNRRSSLWLSSRGLVIACLFFVVASVGVWQLWHRVGLQRFGGTTYQVPLAYVAAALLVILILAMAAVRFRPPASPTSARPRLALSPWLVGFLSFGFGLPWFILIALPYLPGSAFRNVSPALPIGIGLLWMAAGLWIIARLSAAAGWSDPHRLALIFGMSLASMVGGTLAVLADAPIDILGKFAFDLAAIFLFTWFSFHLRRQTQPD